MTQTSLKIQKAVWSLRMGMPSFITWKKSLETLRRYQRWYWKQHCHVKSPVIFSTDMYQDCSVKGVERKRRGCGEKLIVQGEKTRRLKDWKDFLTNDENKEQLIRLLLSTWRSKSFSQKLEGHEVTLICEGRAYQFTSNGESTLYQEIASLESTREETDSRVILYCHYAKEKGFKSVRVRSPDSDIFFILLKHAHELQGIDILFETRKGNKKAWSTLAS